MQPVTIHSLVLARLGAFRFLFSSLPMVHFAARTSVGVL